MTSRRLFPVSFILLTLLFLSAGCGQEDSEQDSGRQATNGQRPMLTIVALGDSLTAGQGLDEEDAYPAQLQRVLAAKGYSCRVVNAGVSGETSSGTLSRLDWILTLKPDIVILETGANDGLRGIEPTVPEKNLREIVRVLKDNGVIVVFTGMKMVWNLGPIYVSRFNSIYPEIAEDEDLIFLPFFLEDVAMVRGLNNEDGLHPNAKGYRKVVENLLPYVVEAIELAEERGES